jgi:putative transposase
VLSAGSLLDRTEWEERGGSEGWADMLVLAIEQRLVSLLRRCTFAGRPFGDEDFVREVEGKLGCHRRRLTYQQELHNQTVMRELETGEGKPKTAVFGA